MRVIRHTEAQLVLRERPWLVWTVSALLAGAGLYVAATAGEVLFGGLFVAIGAAAILVAGRTVTCSFDRGTGQFTREGGRWLGGGPVEVPLTDVVRVRLGRSSGKSQTYRVELIRSSGESVPLTPTYSSGHRAQNATAELVRGFLHLAELPEVPIPGFRDLLGMALNRAPTGIGYDEVIASREAAIQRNPHDVTAYQELATALALHGRPAEARARLQAARELLLGAGKPDDAGRLDEMIARLAAYA